MPTILDPELQCSLLHHVLVHLYASEIAAVYAACVELKETIEGDREWLDANCRHLLPHSYGDIPIMDSSDGTRTGSRTETGIFRPRSGQTVRSGGTRMERSTGMGTSRP